MTKKTALEAACEVVKAAFWTDGGAEFVFGDGSVFIFRDHMDTFVSGGKDTPSNLVITALCLSGDRTKVINAMHLYNTCVAPRPKLIHNLTNAPEHVWRQSSPLDSLVLSGDQSLQATDSTSGVFTLQCALKRTTLTLAPNSAFFTVEWPAVVLGSDNSSYVFVNPVDEYGQITGTVASQRAVRYVTIRQEFLIASPPPEWTTMLALAMRLAGHDVSQEAPLDADVARLLEASDATHVLTLPKTREAVCHNGNMHFADLRNDDIPLLVAATHIQSTSCMQRFHPLTDGKEDVATVTHLYNNVFGWTHANSGVHCTAIVASVVEDSSAVAVEENGNAFVVTHLQRSGKISTYHQSATETIAMPRTIPEADSTTRGRYLPEVVAACVSASKTNAKRLQLRAEKHNMMHGATTANATTSAAVENQQHIPIVSLTTRVDDVGTFCVLSNGITRVSFDDRTILSLTPDEFDSESGLVCTIIDSDATVQHIRVVQVTPQHKAYPYLMYALPFRRFAKLPRGEQETLQFQLPGGPSNTSAAAAPAPAECSQAPSSCGSTPYVQSHQPSVNVSSVSASPHGAVEDLLERTRRVLAASSTTSATSTELLKLRV